MLTIRAQVEDGIIAAAFVENKDGEVVASGIIESQYVWNIKIQYSRQTVSKCVTDFNDVIVELVGFMTRHNNLLAQDAVVNRAEAALNAEYARQAEMSDAHHRAVFHNHIRE